MRLQNKHSLESIKSLHLSNDDFRMCLLFVGKTEKLATLFQQIVFLKRCCKMDIFPKFILNLKLPLFLYYKCNSSFLLKFRKSVLAKNIRFLYENVSTIKSSLSSLRSTIQGLCFAEALFNTAKTSYSSCKAQHKKRLRKKFMWLQAEHVAQVSDRQGNEQCNNDTYKSFFMQSNCVF